MKWALLLVGLVGLPGCSFPEFVVAPASCTDGRRNGDETGIDCGMLGCGVTCDAGQGCQQDADCADAVCIDQICGTASCSDGRANGDESDTDCGGKGDCARCLPAQHCGDVSDCDGGSCTKGRCRDATCTDGLQNGRETDVDCGGVDCPSCPVGLACRETSDCADSACVKGACQPAECGDGVRNQGETDVDCGGSCSSRCADTLHCKATSDCQSAICPTRTGRCAVSACDDGVLNGGEPSIDCGGSCPDTCPLLAACSVAADCETQSCQSKRCLPSTATGRALSSAGWIATASNSFQNDQSLPNAVLDGLQSSDWATGVAQTKGMWFLVDMQEPRVFFSIEIECLNTPGDSAVALDVSLSNDGSFGEAARQNVPGDPQLVVTFGKPQVARYIKLSLAAGSDSWWRMDEFRVKQ